jgi:hypothetical protein
MIKAHYIQSSKETIQELYYEEAFDFSKKKKKRRRF